jgi:pentatricopeptide repeat protein
VSGLSIWAKRKHTYPFSTKHHNRHPIRGLCKKGEIEKAMNFLDDMISKGHEPDVVTYSTRIDWHISDYTQLSPWIINQLIKEPNLKNQSVTNKLGVCILWRHTVQWAGNTIGILQFWPQESSQWVSDHFTHESTSGMWSHKLEGRIGISRTVCFFQFKHYMTQNVANWFDAKAACSNFSIRRAISSCSHLKR